jgi:LysR family pca operon transcriptional activator
MKENCCDNAKRAKVHTLMTMHPAIKLRHIRALLDIAEAGSLSAVARRQRISQPALSRTLAELEALLGHALFHRVRRRLDLTEAGAAFRRHAALGLQSLEAGVAALRPDGIGGVVRIGILPTAATRLIPRVALRFRQEQPDTVLQIETGPHRHLLALLRDGGVDLMIGRMPVASEMAGLSFAHLYEEDIVLVARAGHPLVGSDLRSILQGVPLILPPTDALIRRAVDEYLASLGLAGLRPAVETVALAVGRGILAGSDAVWFISRGVVAEELDRGDVVELPIGVRFLSGSVGITRRQSAPPTPAADLLARLCHEASAARQ